MPPARRARSLAFLLCPALGLGFAGACRDGKDSDADPAANRAGVFALRPVLATPDPPCPEKSTSGDPVYPHVKSGTACFALGDAIVDERDVRTASYSFDLATGPTVNLVLGTTGSANLDDYAARHLGQRLALVVNQRVASAPVIQTPAFLGRIQVNNLPQQEAEQLFRRFKKTG